MEYLDFELEIQSGSGRDYPVAVLHSPAGEVRATMHFPFDQLALESRLDKIQIALLRSGGKRRSVPSPEEQAVQDFGRALFDAVFGGEVRSRYDVSCERAAQEERGLRLKLRIQDPQLAALPWEFLYDSQQAEYICLSRNTPVVRYLELPQRIQSLEVALPLRILGMIASPSDLEPLDVSQEKARVERAVAGLCARGLIEVTWLEGQTWRDLQREMQGGPWHVFHFVGHGGFDDSRDEGFICLTGEDGRARFLDATQLGRLLADHRSLRLVLLNACEGARGGGRDVFSSTASILVRRGIPAVLAMQYPVTDHAAIEFARVFYETLARGLPVDAAVGEARKAVSLEAANTVEWGTPVLYMRSPDGVLFRLRDRRTPPEPAARPPKVEASSAGEPVPDRERLHSLLVEHFDDDELRTLCTDLSVDYESLPGKEKAGKARELVAHCERRGRLAELAATVQRLRPHVAGGSRPGGSPSATPPKTGGSAPVERGSEAAVPRSGPTKVESAPLALTAPQPEASPVPSSATRAKSGTQAAVSRAQTAQAEAKQVIQPPLGSAPDTFTISSPVLLELVRVPAGKFLMGNDAKTYPEAYATEMPQHQVDVGDFYVGKYPVTNAQYAAFVAATGQRAPDHWTGGKVPAGKADHPVGNVSWDEALAFCRWLTRASGVAVRLPTEVEWEKAARGADGRQYPWGQNRPNKSLCNFNGNVGGTTPVGQYPKGESPYHVLDMSGNVFEWCLTKWRKDYWAEPDDSAEGKARRVVRGGSYRFDALTVRCTYRGGSDPDYRHGSFGFRVVASPVR